MNIEIAFINEEHYNIEANDDKSKLWKLYRAMELKITGAEDSNEELDDVCMFDELSTQTFAAPDPSGIKSGPSRFEPGPSEISSQDIHLELKSDEEIILETPQKTYELIQNSPFRSYFKISPQLIMKRNLTQIRSNYPLLYLVMFTMKV